MEEIKVLCLGITWFGSEKSEVESHVEGKTCFGPRPTEHKIVQSTLVAEYKGVVHLLTESCKLLSPKVLFK